MRTRKEIERQVNEEMARANSSVQATEVYTQKALEVLLDIRDLLALHAPEVKNEV